METSTEELALIFKALGDPTRLRIFQTLRCCGASVEVDDSGAVRPAGSLSVGEVCCRIGGSGSTLSHHLKELRLAGLIRMEKRGRWIYCSVNPEALETIQAFIEGEEAGQCQEAAARETACC
jgi:ArsR family transcriptional regulator, arsenate/arsenite/antimonite-responsive transcriptional repressor